MKVLKFGGTSVGTAERMKSVAGLIDDGEPKLIVLSAMSGTTNGLVQINEFLLKGESEKARDFSIHLLNRYNQVIDDLFAKSENKSKALRRLNEISERFHELQTLTYTPSIANEILSFGELLSTFLFSTYLNEIGLNNVYLPALNFMRVDKDGEPDQYYIRENLIREIKGQSQATIFITQGFICRDVEGNISNLDRGGSDYSASLMGAAIKAEEIQIWTDIDGIHNNDPRYVHNTRALSTISFDEAAELAYFGAKILHPSSVAPAKAENIPVRLKNTMDPNAEGTLISAEKTGIGIKAIAAKDQITAINITSSKMLMAHGFLNKVFEVFGKHETAVDMITTSEVALSLTVDDPKQLGSITDELKSYGKIEVDDDLSIICIVGDFIAESKGYAFRIFQALQNVPIRMISFGGSKNNISVLVKTSDKVEALVALNENLFNS